MSKYCPSCMGEVPEYSQDCPFCGSSLHLQNRSYQLPVGSVLRGRYLIGSALGAGGFGITYVGLDLTLRQKVAIKEYYPSGAANRGLEGQVSPVSQQRGSSFRIGLEHFINEAKILSHFVSDPNVVTVRDWFEENGTAYIVMEFISGRDLRQLLEEKGPLSFSEAMAIITPAAQCLGRIHAQGLLHGDISPSNIMLSDSGTVKLLDFGTARSQGSRVDFDSSLMLKPGYAPEEAYRQQAELDARVDIYALSATLYKLITGQTPETAQDRLFEDRLQPPSKLGAQLSKAQESALLQGMALRAEDRPESMAALLQLLSKDKLGLTDWLQSRKNKMILAGAACVLCAVLALPLLFHQETSLPAAQAPASTSAVERKSHEDRVRLPVALSEDAYPFSLSAGMEPMAGFERQDLVNFKGHHISVNACYVGNSQLCLELELANDGESDFSLSEITMLLPEQELSGQMDYLSLKPGSHRTASVWFNTNMISLVGESTLQNLTLDLDIFAFDLYEEYNNNQIGEGCVIHLPYKLKLDAWDIKKPVLLYKGRYENSSYSKLTYRLECWGLSLRQDDYQGDMLLRLTLIPDTKNNYWYFKLGAGDLQVTADGLSIISQPSLNIPSINDPDRSLFFYLPFHYGFSAVPDEMNVLHSGKELPKELEISFTINPDYNTKSTAVELDSLRFAIDENGVGRLVE